MLAALRRRTHEHHAKDMTGMGEGSIKPEGPMKSLWGQSPSDHSHNLGSTPGIHTYLESNDSRTGQREGGTGATNQQRKRTVYTAKERKDYSALKGLGVAVIIKHQYHNEY